MEYTAIGSTVNIASRLCGTAGPGQIVISDETRARIGDAFALEPLPPVHVKGIEREFQTYLVVGPAPHLR
jgi:adenylate cyclase